ncbi:Probable 1-acyl-sn-glycerol-3-phosphate acyltransferase 5 (Lysophosphatidyl acyltransferase 5) [Durusdinium trenchii]|uniref:Probable 1-acyl-sn-glycerol-3-phosphate acyltransferase 5 (Lysophosphatidyl acyltransferase 5) n=1 Tax=Durusdinium trenchii TaxID=1381693 RepID=A0ABP0ME11_9DINO
MSPEEAFEMKMRTLTSSVIKRGKLRTRRAGAGQKVRKRDKLFNRVKGEWSTNTVFIDNQKFIVQPLEESGAKRVEIMLASIKHVLPTEDGTDFALTWTSSEVADTVSPGKKTVNEFENENGEFVMGADLGFSDDEDEEEMGARLKDEVLVFRAATVEEARSWINALNRAIQISRSTQVTSSFKMLREYSTMGEEVDRWAEGEPGAVVGKNKKRGNLNQAERMWAKANRDAKRLPRPVQAFGRLSGSIATTLSITMVGGFFKSLLKAGVAPTQMRRATMEVFQSVWLDAITFFAPEMLFHVSGDLPEPLIDTKQNKRDRRKARRERRRREKRLSSRSSGSRGSRSSVADEEEEEDTASLRASLTRDPSAVKPLRVMVMNSACECDLLFVMMLAKAIEESQGRVKGYISNDERNELLGLGAVFDIFGFVSLVRRDKEKAQAHDAKRIKKHLSQLFKDDAYEWAVIFPERGYPSVKTIRKQSEVHDGDRPELELSLLPDANELEAILDAAEGRPVEIFDMTLSYEGFRGQLPESDGEFKVYARDSRLPTYKNLLGGTSSENIHINLKQFQPDDVASHPAGVAGWLDERWERKDRMLQHFSDYQAFPPDDDEDEIRRDAFTVKGNALPMVFVWLFNLFAISFIFVYLF